MSSPEIKSGIPARRLMSWTSGKKFKMITLMVQSDNLLSSLECELKVMLPVLFAQFVEIKGLKSYILDFFYLECLVF